MILAIVKKHSKARGWRGPEPRSGRTVGSNSSPIRPILRPSVKILGFPAQRCATASAHILDIDVNTNLNGTLSSIRLGYSTTRPYFKRLPIMTDDVHRPSPGALQSLIYTPRSPQSEQPSLEVLDQLLLPNKKAYIPVKTTQDAWKVIRDMNVRGAPLIAIVAVLSLAVEMSAKSNVQGKDGFASLQAAAAWLQEAVVYLKTSRPTAVNLFTAMDEVLLLSQATTKKHDAVGACVQNAAPLVSAVVRFAEQMLKEDVESNQAIGDHGAAAILANLLPGQGVKVLTHCNTGSLATAGYGTALGVIRSLHKEGRLARVFCTETRPYNQGARLTAFELVQDQLPGTLITDSMVSFLMATQGLDAIVVGADRIAANGDTANKIGTYQLAVTAKHHGVAFYVAAPFTSFDLSLASGDQIEIEERPARELTQVQGIQVAPQEIAVWNPGFDVTPASLITGIITEKGVIHPFPSAGATDAKPRVPTQETGEARRKSNGTVGHGRRMTFDIPGFLNGEGAHQIPSSLPDAAAPTPSMELDSANLPSPSSGYEALSEENVALFLEKHVRDVWDLLGARTGAEVEISEVGDGNLNLVFIVRGPKNTVVVKQALPYVRCVGESWPLTLDRAFYEAAALQEEGRHTPRLVPEVYYSNRALALIVMQFVPPPHIILRKALIRGDVLSTLAADLSDFMARNLFFTSSFHHSGPSKREAVAFWSGNHGLCALTEAVVFTEPYCPEVAHNRWTSPALDETVAQLRQDQALKVAVGKLKAKFMDSTEALCHGDLHTGSVMVKEGSTVVIDPEFAFYGPMGFECGALMANFWLNYFSQAGRASDGGGRHEYAEWVLDTSVAIWQEFCAKFLALWADAATHQGEGFKRVAYAKPEELRAAQEAFVQDLLRDTLGFAGCKMIRRIIGIAHVEDLESIADPQVRAACEKRALSMARTLVVHGREYASMEAVAALARKA